MGDVAGAGRAGGASPRVIAAADLTGLVIRLRALDASWHLTDAPVVAEAMGWRTLVSRDRWVLLDTGFGPGSGKFHAEDGRVVRIEVRLSDFAADTPEGHAWVAGIFDEAVATVAAAIGAPDDSRPDDGARVRWAGPEVTLMLQRTPVSVLLWWITNARLAADDRNIELEDQGLL
ncbi:DUF6301 family protein [Nocardia arizonensis]|uniref:DUF6301 family protein n=1 Tax=Nocardia arizonensis TaxID=1141647 RepID=UPI0006D1DFA1|nr:DUF6301 family protein [Nocardia arizonensis]